MQKESPGFDIKIKKLVLNKWFWIIFILFNFSYPIYRSLNRTITKIPTFSQLPKYQLVDELNTKFGSTDLNNKVYIANFMFTRCAGVCVKTLKATQKLQKRLRNVGDKVRLVTFTVDPENDTPSVLNKTSRKMKANPRLWKFLTGTREQLTNLFVKGFKVYMPENNGSAPSIVDKGKAYDKKPDLYELAHSEKFILVDQTGTIRGYYNMEKQSLNKLMIDVGLLINGFI
jgi:protein SCO1